MIPRLSMRSLVFVVFSSLTRYRGEQGKGNYGRKRVKAIDLFKLDGEPMGEELQTLRSKGVITREIRLDRSTEESPSNSRRAESPEARPVAEDSSKLKDSVASAGDVEVVPGSIRPPLSREQHEVL